MNLDELRSRLGGVGDGGLQEQDSGSPGLFADCDAADRDTVSDDAVGARLAEIEMAARLGYLLCQCTWPPQIMVLGADGHLFCCPRCHRRRDF